MDYLKLKDYLDDLVRTYEVPDFIHHDPISIPHRFVLKQDIEISALFAATFAWGLRKTIISKTDELMQRMDDAPYDFVLNHSEKELKKCQDFKHRTFQPDDLNYFIHFLKYHYSTADSLESAFSNELRKTDLATSLSHFHQYFFSLSHLQRTQKHLSSPANNAACKRLCMFLRWMVRSNKNQVDFGLWRTISPSELYIPLDLHVYRIALKLGLVRSTKKDWKTVIELTNNLRQMDAEDPVKYDFALFNLSLHQGIL